MDYRLGGSRDPNPDKLGRVPYTLPSLTGFSPISPPTPSGARIVVPMKTTAASALLLLALGSALSAASFTGALDNLAEELAFRRDNDFTGTLDKTQKKQKAAVLKSLKQLDRPADDLGDDLKTAGKVAKLLEKAYTEEFAAPGILLTLGGLTDAALDALDEEVGAFRASVEEGLAALSGSALAKAQALLDKADAEREASLLATTRAARAKGLAKAWSLLSKAMKIIEKAGGGPGAEGLTAEIDAVPYAASTWQASVATGSQSFLILATSGEYPAARTNIFISFEGFDGAGTFSLAGSSSNVQVFAADSTQAVFHGVDTGTITVTVYDPPNRIAGTFSMTTASDPGTLVVTDGKFDIRAPEFSVSE